MLKIRWKEFQTFSGSCHHQYYSDQVGSYLDNIIFTCTSVVPTDVYMECNSNKSVETHDEYEIANVYEINNVNNESVEIVKTEVEKIDAENVEYQESKELKQFVQAIPLMLPAPLNEEYLLAQQIEEMQHKLSLTKIKI